MAPTVVVSMEHISTRFQRWCKHKLVTTTKNLEWSGLIVHKQAGRSPKVVALTATNFRSNIIELLQLHDTIQI